LLHENATLPQAVDSLDELLFAVRTDSGLRLDPALGFDFYATDLVLQAQAAGWTAAAVDAYCEHWSDTPVAVLPRRLWRRIGASAAVFERKWEQRLPLCTPCFDIARVGATQAFLEGGTMVEWVLSLEPDAPQASAEFAEGLAQLRMLVSPGRNGCLPMRRAQVIFRRHWHTCCSRPNTGPARNACWSWHMCSCSSRMTCLSAWLQQYTMGLQMAPWMQRCAGARPVCRLGLHRTIARYAVWSAMRGPWPWQYPLSTPHGTPWLCLQAARWP
jgi:hypothetical protein